MRWCPHSRVKGVRVLSTLTSTWRHTNRNPVFGNSAPGSSPASHSTWNPLQIPNTGRASAANSATAPITGEKRAIAPARR